MLTTIEMIFLLSFIQWYDYSTFFPHCKWRVWVISQQKRRVFYGCWDLPPHLLCMSPQFVKHDASWRWLKGDSGDFQAVNRCSDVTAMTLRRTRCRLVVWRMRESGAWCGERIMVPVEATLSTYIAIKPRTQWTSSSVKSVHRSYKRIYGLCNGVW